MPTYSNGHVPDSLLVTFKTGWSSNDGNWKHQLSAGTLQKHNRLVELARKRTGRTLEISEGWGAYRPYNIQEVARRLYGNGAAWPGTSSHGGFWEGQQTLAIDYGNWGWVYDWDRAAFYADVRAAGLAPGLIHPSRGNNYPDEPWHVVDLTPWTAPTGSGSSVSGRPEEEDPMPKHESKENTTRQALKPGFNVREVTPKQLYLADYSAGGGEVGEMVVFVEADAPAGAVIQIRAVYEGVKGGKVSTTRKQPTVEIPATSGGTFGQYVLPYNFRNGRMFLQIGVTGDPAGKTVVTKTTVKKNYWNG